MQNNVRTILCFEDIMITIMYGMLCIALYSCILLFCRCVCFDPQWMKTVRVC